MAGPSDSDPDPAHREPGPGVHIAFDATPLWSPWTGVGRSFAIALAAYVERAEDRRISLVVAGDASGNMPGHVPQTDSSRRDASRSSTDECADPDAGLRAVLARLPRIHVRAGGWARRFGWRNALRSAAVDLLHSPFAAVPLRAPCAVVATVHDLPWCTALDASEPGRDWRARAAVSLAARRCAAIVVPSTHTASDLRTWLGHEPTAHIAVIPHGLDAPEQIGDAPRPSGLGQPGTSGRTNGLTRHATPPSRPGTRDRSHHRDSAAESIASGPFVYLGDDRPRKNLARLRRAHARARSREPSLPDLVLIGAAGDGHLDEATKRRILRSATAVVVPSLLEGFGLPVLEAFAHRVPVLASRAGSLPEVGGVAAVYCDPTDEVELADRLLELHAEPELRATLCRAGLRQLGRFTPQATAEGWRKLHDAILGA